VRYDEDEDEYSFHWQREIGLQDSIMHHIIASKHFHDISIWILRVMLMMMMSHPQALPPEENFKMILNWIIDRS